MFYEPFGGITLVQGRIEKCEIEEARQKCSNHSSA